MKFFKIFAIATFLFSTTALAQEEFQSLETRVGAYEWECTLNGEMDGVSVGLGFGFKHLEGEGEYACKSTKTGRSATPIRVKLELIGLGMGVGAAKISNVQVQSAGLLIGKDASPLVGTFNAGISIGAHLIKKGLYFDIALKLNRNNVGFELGFTHADVIGLGWEKHIQVFRITPL